MYILQTYSIWVDELIKKTANSISVGSLPEKPNSLRNTDELNIHNCNLIFKIFE